MRQLKTRLRIEKTVYDNGINVALHHVENSKIYRDFKKQVKKSLLTQIRQVANERNIYELLLFVKAKKLNESLITQITTIMTRLSELLGMAHYLIRVGREGGQAFLDKVGIESTFIMQNERVIKYLEDHSNLLIRSVDDTTREWLASKIQEGKDKLLAPKEIVDLILNESDVFTSVRAEMIVLTETANAMMVTELATAEEYGIREVIWRTSIDDRVCPICLPLEGSRTVIGKSFGDNYFHPPAHPNCRCFIEEVIPKDWMYGQ